jgi:plasmid stabilization system protein ParE
MVKWSLLAKTDLKQIRDYIATDSRYYAKKVAQAIVEKTEDLAAFPEMGRIVPEIGDARVRDSCLFLPLDLRDHSGWHRNPWSYTRQARFFSKITET